MLILTAGCPNKNTKTGPSTATLAPVDSTLVGELSGRVIGEWKNSVTLNNDESAAFSLAVCYMRGEGVEKDEAEAKNYLDLIKDTKNPGIRMFVKRMGIKADEAMVKEWMEKGKAGDVEAMLNVGASYFLGEGVAEDRVQALKWIIGASTRHEFEGAFDTVLGRVGDRLTLQQQGYARRKAQEEGLAIERTDAKSQ